MTQTTSQSAYMTLEWARYVQYLHKWADSHSTSEYHGMTPASFEEWQVSEDAENQDSEAFSSTVTTACFWEKLLCGLPMCKIMDISTRHITHDDDVLLHAECDADLPVVIVFRKADTGYFVHVSHDDVEESERAMFDAGYSQAFVNLVRIARAGGASMLCLDGDASTSEKLSVFDW